jgi:predicted O-linked N-acetylglucosamine transferase (SPINDLY family)
MQNQNPKKSEINSLTQFYSEGEFEKVLAQSEELIKSFPKSALLHNIRGASYAGLKDSKSAIKSYMKSIAVEPLYARAHYNLAGIYHELGQNEKSVESYKDSLQIDPQFADAHNNLGNVFRELGSFQDAINSYSKAIQIKPDYIEAYYSLSLVFQDLGDFDTMIKYSDKVLSFDSELIDVHCRMGFGFRELNKLSDAVVSFQKALRIKPDLSEIHNNLGETFKDLNQYDQAIKSYLAAIKLDPGSHNYINNLAVAYKESGQIDNAIKSYREGILKNPKNLDLLNNLGVLLIENDKNEEAIKYFKKAIEINSGYAEAYNNLSVALKNLDQFDNAIEKLEIALSLNSNYADAFNNYGSILKKLGRSDESINYFRKAIVINPKDPDTLNNLGSVYDDLEKFDQAIEFYQKALEIKPSFAEVNSNLGNIYSQRNEYDKAIKYYQKALKIKPDLDYIIGYIFSAKMNCCDWAGFEDLLGSVKKKVNKKNKIIDPFSLFGLIDNPSLIKTTVQQKMSSEHPRINDLKIISASAAHKKIRIGYFSGDFRQHPVSYLTAELYEVHNRQSFEIHAFSLGPDTNDELNLRIKAGVDHFHDVQKMSHKDIVLLARSLELDIAVDLAGLTAKSRTDIFAMSVAPIQLSYIGWLGTMGADYYDYLIADKVMIPNESQKYYVEKIVYLPSFQVNDSKDLPPNLELTREEIGVPEAGFVFCCFNNTYKFTPNTFDSWCRILSKVDNSVLLVYANNNLAKTNLTKEIVKRGIDAERLIFGESLDRPRYLARYRVADLFLDTQPYNAGTTASDALKMGLPIVTLKGKSYQARMGASILNAVNLPELITNSSVEYEALAIELAKNPKKLKTIKEKLLKNLSTAPLYNTELFAKNLELAYTKMYERHLKGLEPDHIYIE